MIIIGILIIILINYITYKLSNYTSVKCYYSKYLNFKPFCCALCSMFWMQNIIYICILGGLPIFAVSGILINCVVAICRIIYQKNNTKNIE